MAHIPDLAPCGYFDADPEGKLLAVGWLEPDQPYAFGEVDGGFRAALARIISDPWKVLLYRGCHGCDCRRFPHRKEGSRLTPSDERVGPDSLTARSGVYNLFVPGRGCVYAAPELILHYIDVHGYAPPKAFQKAVLACPAVRSAPYLKAIVKKGPSWLAEEARREIARQQATPTGPDPR